MEQLTNFVTKSFEFNINNCNGRLVNVMEFHNHKENISKSIDADSLSDEEESLDIDITDLSETNKKKCEEFEKNVENKSQNGTRNWLITDSIDKKNVEDYSENIKLKSINYNKLNSNLALSFMFKDAVDSSDTDGIKNIEIKDEISKADPKTKDLEGKYSLWIIVVQLFSIIIKNDNIK